MTGHPSLRNILLTIPARPLAASILLVVVLFALSPDLIRAQTTVIDERSEEIIHQCIEAMGGQMELATVQFQVNGHIGRTAQPGSEFEIKVMDGNVWLSENDGETVTVFNGKHRWRSRNGLNPKLMDRDTDHSFIEHTVFPHVALSWLEFEGVIRFIGSKSFGSQETWDLEFTPHSGEEFNLFFDQETKLPIRKRVDDVLHHFEFVRNGDFQYPARQFRQAGDHITGYFFNRDNYDTTSDVPIELFAIPAELERELQRQIDK